MNRFGLIFSLVNREKRDKEFTTFVYTWYRWAWSGQGRSSDFPATSKVAIANVHSCWRHNPEASRRQKISAAVAYKVSLEFKVISLLATAHVKTKWERVGYLLGTYALNRTALKMWRLRRENSQALLLSGRDSSDKETPSLFLAETATVRSRARARTQLSDSWLRRTRLCDAHTILKHAPRAGLHTTRTSSHVGLFTTPSLYRY